MRPRQISQERLQVLRMIDEGKITPEEGFQLLKVLTPVETEPARAHPNARAFEILKGKLVRLQVMDLASGRSKATASVPLRLLEVGLRVASHYVPGLKDLNSDDLLEALAEGETGRIIEVIDEEKQVRVEVLIE